MNLAEREVVESWTADALEFCSDVFPAMPLRPWQTEALTAFQTTGKLAVAGGRGIGKTHFDVMAALWILVTKPESCVLVVSPTWSQTQIFFEELRRVWSASRLPGLFPEWQILDSELRTGTPGHRLLGLSAESGERIEGFHAPTIGLCYDEAALCPDYIRRTSRAMIAGASEVFEVATSTPRNPAGWFFSLWQNPAWSTMRVSALDVSETADFAAELAGDGEADAFYRSHVLAEFADAGGEDVLFTVQMIESAVGRVLVPSPGPALRVLGVDPSGGRGDEFAVALRDGNSIVRVEAFSGLDPMVACGRVLNLAGETDAWEIVVDSAGLGLTVYSRLCEVAAEDRRWGGRLRIREWNAGKKARDPERFANAKSELLYQIRGRFERGEISIPDDRKLAAQFLSYTTTTDSRGRLRTIDPAGHSPDRADACVLAFAFESASRPSIQFGHLDF